MASLRDIKRRITSVKSTQKITRAMKIVAAAKLRRAQEAIVQARPYAYRMRALASDVATRADRDAHPLLRQHVDDQGPIHLIAVTGDRGLSGAYNANIINRTIELTDHEFTGRDVHVTMVGRRGVDAFKRRRRSLASSYTGVADGPVFRTAGDIIGEPVRAFAEGECAGVYVLYAEFKSAISQHVTLEQFLPLQADPPAGPETPVDFIYEPGEPAVLGQLLERHLRVQMHRVLFEAAASEQGARMTAMDAATKNAGNMIEQLSQQYNRARQEAITTELIEVISGAEAL
mgnify:CR=1 FL=1